MVDIAADVLAMMQRGGAVVTVASVTTKGLVDTEGVKVLRDLRAKRIRVRTPTGALPGIAIGAGMTVDGTEYVVTRVLQVDEGAVTMSELAQKEGSTPTLTAQDMGNGRWRFTSNSPADTINAATVTATEAGVGTVQLINHDDVPHERQVQLLTITASLFEAQHGEQGAADYEWVVSGVETPGGVAFAALSVRFTIP